MYETEANVTIGAVEELSPDVVSFFAESRQTVTSRTLIPWSEHCTECVWPTCYKTCDLYSPRTDGRCRRFVDGMVRIDCPGSLNNYILKISFKRWGRLWSPASLNLHSLAAAERAERRDFQFASFIHALPVAAVQRTLTLKRYSIKKRSAMHGAVEDVQPDCFLMECYNPNPKSVSITLTARQDSNPMPFQALLVMQPGFNRHRVAIEEFVRVLDFSKHFGIDLTPNDIADGHTLYFGAIDFVVDSAFRVNFKPSAIPCKCVVWDLDSTLWSGTLIEDGAENIRLRPGMGDLLKELDARGILLSIASKNNHDDAVAVLRRFGIEEYFLFPQISWNPKGEGIQRIANGLNIGIDSFLFVDDSPFERQQVQSMCPGIKVLDAADYDTILERPDCKLPVSRESRTRRGFYREQQTRDEAQKEFSGEYLTFLRDCQLHLTIRTMTEANLERVYELAQRTNQMNFSGNRYTREQLRDFLLMEEFDTYVMDCDDKFGSYGTIGFCIVQKSDVHMIDLMFSCRIQAKRVEHAALSFLIERYRNLSALDFLADYRKTKKNALQGKIFDDFGFQLVGEEAAITKLVFPKSLAVPHDRIVAIEDLTVS